jgi:hypothetical protein
MNDTPGLIDGPTIGAGVVAAITDLYAIIGHNGLTDAQSKGIVGLVTIVFVFGAFLYHAAKVHAWIGSPAQLVKLGLVDQGDGPPPVE